MTIIAETPRISHPALFSSTAAVKGFANGTGDPYLDLPTPDGPPVPLHDLPPPFPVSALSLLERSPSHSPVDAPAGYMASDDIGDPLQKDIAGKTPPVTLSESARQTGASRQRQPSQPGPSSQPRRQPPMRPPFHNTPSSSSTGRENASNSPGPPGPPPTYPAPSPYPPSSFGQHRNSFVGPQYTMSTHQPSMSGMHSSTQYVYSHHPGMHDPSIAHMAYSSPSHMPMIHAPMFPSYTPPDQGLNMQHPFSTAPPPQHSLYAQPPVATSPPPISPPQGSGGSHSGPHVSTSFGSSQNAYGGYSAPHQYAFRAPHSYAPTPTMYSPTYPSPFPQSYGASNERESQQGTWWYLPPSHSSAPSPYDNNRPPFQPPYSMGYSPSVARREGGYAQGQPISPTAPSPASPRRQPAQTSWAGGSQTSTREDLLSAPAVTASPKRPKLSRAVSSLSETERVSGRQSYHPNPPAQRSEWVMWAGNVPSDATHDELWRFFNQPLLLSPSPSEPDVSSSAQTGNAAGAHGGVSSIFLISRSNCAFVNFETEKHLQTATARFNGQPIRPNDPRCPRLVCRVRRRTDDLKAGVGGQRGLGMHTKWVKEQKTRMSAARTRGGTGSPTSPDTSSPEDELAGRYSGLSMSDDEGGRRRKVGSHTDSSGSFASTNSSFLAKHFPQRYFILKSLTQHDLDLSVQRGVWATQRHNEGILDQAFRTSQDVYLIFGVNKSGEFYGYARMTGGISQSQDRIPWESTSSSQGSSQRKAEGGFILSPREHRFADSSPQPVSAPEDDISFPPSAPSSGALLSIPPHKTGSSRPHYPSGQAATAPAEMGDPHVPLSHRTPIPGFSLNVAPVVAVPAAHHTFELDTMAPYKAIRHPDEGTSEPIPPADVRKEQLLPVQEELAASNPVTPAAADADTEPEEVWGQPFRIEWIKTDRLPFYRTRHLRNPWNHGREVKVSRDGTELEPTLGKELLEEWDRPAVSPPTSPVPAQRPPSQRRARPLSAVAPASTTRTS